MRYAFSPGRVTARREWIRDGLERALARHGHVQGRYDDPDTGLVFHWVDGDKPRPFRRRGRGTFVVAVTEGAASRGDVLAEHYPTMIRALANLLIVFAGTAGGKECAYVVTLERGAYPVKADGGDLFEHVYRRIHPLASSRLVIDNVFEADLPQELWQGDERTRAIAAAGARLDRLNLLPAPFPIREMLSESDFRHLQRLYQIGGLSYGNLSARQDGVRFWMSGSGVDKSDLRVIGRDILLVKGFDPGRNAIVLSVPPGMTPNRVSVDAIEHWMIYSEHPRVGAVLHIHAWMDGIASTDVNYPCGTLELAQAVADRLKREPDPGRAVVGLRNHGLTITGPSLEDIFERIEGRVKIQVPMT